MTDLTFNIPLWQKGGKGWTRERLLAERAENRLVFDRLFGGQAIDLENMTFKPAELWATYPNVAAIPGLATAPIAGFLDPALGGGKGDFSALVTACLGGDGRFYVLDCKMSQTAKPVDAVDWMFAQHAALGQMGRQGQGYATLGVESNGFQQLIMPLIAAKAEAVRRAGGPYQLPIKAIPAEGKKEARILRLHAPIENGWLVIPEDATTRWPELFAQMEGYGPDSRPAHDDGPDALDQCVHLLRALQSRQGFQSPRPRNIREGVAATSGF